MNYLNIDTEDSIRSLSDYHVRSFLRMLYFLQYQTEKLNILKIE